MMLEGETKLEITKESTDSPRKTENNSVSEIINAQKFELKQELEMVTTFMEYWEEVHEKLKRLALKKTYDEDEAKDLLNTTAQKAYTNFHQFKSGTNFLAWTARILVNTYINQWRKNKKQSQGLKALEEKQILENESHIERNKDYGPEKFLRTFMEKERKLTSAIKSRKDSKEKITHEIAEIALEYIRVTCDDQIFNAVREIGEQFLATFFLVDIFDYKYKEAAEIMRIQVGTVMSRLFRIRHILAAKLENYRDRIVKPPKEEEEEE